MGIGKYVSPSAWKERVKRWRRTIEVARKPDRDDFMSSAKITGSGILALGAVGFVIFLVWHFVNLLL
jgi:protein translocase SEC61 complex gamma subunit